MTSHGKQLGAVLAGICAIALAGCGLQPATSIVAEAGPGSIRQVELPEDAEITVTAKNFTEQLILGKIGVIAAKAAGFEVEDMTNVPGSQPVRELMVSGRADMTWEYTGTAWLTYLAEAEGIPDQQEQWQAVHDADLKNGLTWEMPAPLNNTYAFAMPRETSEKLGVTKLSQIAELPKEQRTFCIESEFNSRADGFNPMLEHYGMSRGDSGDVPNANVEILDTGAVYTATDQGLCNFGEVFASDGRIQSLDLVVLEDDEKFFPAYNAAAVFRTETLETYPELSDIFGQISPKLTTEALQALNRKVDVDGEEPADVAYDWMVEEGLITRP
ncbi:glycine betaine ABC transporter substrate-binding protein [Saxibacter everestensis]|uniref:Glycine betaine ABC transporter substrate-binding protein n=1 Tax=Saxibacter everestensis TaxID=2909229 RepID=A0ABY8QYY4_9MICO|nr:glycine betaine ABC transporter substrate-binding protein [Brevibacteriaceae bacterium ZFBP1038]